MTVEHRFGTVTLTKPPVKVVTLGLQESEGVLLLGLAPTGRTDTDITDWYNAFLTSMQLPGSELPQLVSTGAGVPVDAIAKLQPDLVIAFETPVSQAAYDSLSKVAPVILPPKGLDLADWKATLTFFGQILGRTAIAQQQIAATEAALTNSAADYPELRKTSAMYVAASSIPGSDITVFAPDSAPSRFLASLGMKASPSAGIARSLPAALTKATQPANLLPRSRSNELSPDVLVVVVPGSDYGQYTANKAIQGMADFGTKNILYVTGPDAFSMDRASALALQWASRNIVPEIGRLAYAATK
ncbi:MULTISPECIES: ABC transporter substrate-binding protein [Arthrobacter]|uniref:ABC transporter substrate-binding protein n=2 Tax=Arthrobacter TaxID=1663 RepID=A0ABU9KJY3_9MICC|nr:ABC transporter substrate-binding protein [Arthrobacter sp. YJM1]MDP5227236.1 ABC transporter substrate-binding protein [Arthrobacter sp. YJM1]